MTPPVNAPKPLAPGGSSPARSPRPAAARPGTRFRPRLDPLEARALLSTLTVTSASDSGSGSLRATLAAAAAGDTIAFSPRLDGQTITLTGGPLTIGVGVTIDGPGAAALTVSGGGKQRVFIVPAGVTAAIDGLTIADGVAVQGGGIDNSGTLTVDRCTLLNNRAVGGSGDSTTPDAANGGGIANEVGASLSLIGSTLQNNTAAASPGNDSFGGALLNLGSATIADSTFTGNQATGGASNTFFDASSGGAIESYGLPPDQLYGSTIQVNDCTFSGNEAVAAATGASEGGAVDLQFGVVATIDDTRFTGNVVTGGSVESPFADGGAAINTEGCTLTLADSAFTGNQAIGPDGAEAVGGALSLDASGTTVNARDCTFTGNLAQGESSTGAALGGALENYGGSVTLVNSILTANRAIGGTGTGAVAPYANLVAGGAINNIGGGAITITDSTLAGNQAIGGSGNPNDPDSQNGYAFGGGIDNWAGSTLMVLDSTLSGNLAQAGTNTTGVNGQAIGGGIENEGTLTLGNSLLSGNRAIGAAGADGMVGGDGFGGGLDDSFGATATVTSTIFADNLAEGGAGGHGTGGGDGIGGGISVAIGSILGTPDASSLSLSGGTLIGNVAQGGAGGMGANGGDGWGGGLFVGTGGSAVLSDALVFLNVAIGGPAGSGGTDGDGIGGGLYVVSGASVTLKKSRVTGNFASASNDNIYGMVSAV